MHFGGEHFGLDAATPDLAKLDGAAPTPQAVLERNFTVKHFVNSHEDIVTQAVDGLILAAGSGKLARLDGFPAIKVVLRADRNPAKVAVISGGGSGHEPGHAGFVGEGLLDAAVCGDIFASPSVDAVLAAILAVSGPAGCLLIVKNYNGDRLNFGLAAERARAMGHAVEMVIVADDIALRDNPRPRGVAGVMFVHKAAGYAAAQGLSLSDVRQSAENVSNSVRSLGIAVSSCTIPGRASQDRMAAGEAELGLGIHGEPGIERITLPPSAELMTTMLARFGEDIRTAPRLALLINNLGAVPALEMGVIARDILSSEIGRRVELILGPAHAVTALDMRGFSISLMPLDDARAAMLTAPIAVAAWPQAQRPVAAVPVRPLPKALEMIADAPSANDKIRRSLMIACDTLTDHQEALDALDAKIGDGDTGSTFAAAARRIVADLDQLPLAEPGLLFRALANRLSLVMGGSSGVLLSILFSAASAAMLRGEPLAEALRAGIERMQHYGGAAEGDRTMIDALLPAVRALGAGGSVADAAAAAQTGAAATASMTASRAGRSSYVGAADLKGVMDPGAHAVALVFAALAEQS